MMDLGIQEVGSRFVSVVVALAYLLTCNRRGQKVRLLYHPPYHEYVHLSCHLIVLDGPWRFLVEARRVSTLAPVLHMRG